MQQMGIKDI